jgi:hypothetical protein
LDEAEEEVLSIMKRRGIHSWLKGWDDPDLQRNIQQLFSKQRAKS